MLNKYFSGVTAGREAFEYEDLKKALDQYPVADLNDLQFIIYSCSKKGIGWFSNLTPFDLDPLSNIRVAGSGTEYFIQNVPNIRGAQGSPEMQALALTNLASAQQLFEGKGIAEGWGVALR